MQQKFRPAKKVRYGSYLLDAPIMIADTLSRVIHLGHLVRLSFSFFLFLSLIHVAGVRTYSYIPFPLSRAIDYRRIIGGKSRYPFRTTGNNMSVFNVRSPCLNMLLPSDTSTVEFDPGCEAMIYDIEGVPLQGFFFFVSCPPQY